MVLWLAKKLCKLTTHYLAIGSSHKMEKGNIASAKSVCGRQLFVCVVFL